MKAYDWDSTIKEDGQDFILLAPGTYSAIVEKYEKQWHEGSDKIGPCPKAVVTALISTDKGDARITDRFLLHEKLEWKLSQFFTSVGMKENGEEVRIDFDQAVGRTCRVKVSNRPGFGDKSDTLYNEIETWIAPEQEKSAGSFSKGKF